MYIRDSTKQSTEPYTPQIIEEDTASEGSIVAIHDSNVVQFPFDDTLDRVLNRNFRFVHNLCTVYPMR